MQNEPIINSDGYSTGSYCKYRGLFWFGYFLLLLPIQIQKHPSNHNTEDFLQNKRTLCKLPGFIQVGTN